MVMPSVPNIPGGHGSNIRSADMSHEAEFDTMMRSSRELVEVFVTSVRQQEGKEPDA